MAFTIVKKDMGYDMAVREIAVELPQLNNGINSIQTKLVEVRHIMKELFASMEQLDAMWDGPANAALMAQFKNDNNNMESVCKSIDHMIESYRNAHKEYVKCESSVQGIINSLKF